MDLNQLPKKNILTNSPFQSASRGVDSERISNSNIERSLLEYFFEEEELLTSKSSEKISTNRHNETELAQHTAELLLYMLLPEEELKSRIVVKLGARYFALI